MSTTVDSTGAVPSIEKDTTPSASSSLENAKNTVVSSKPNTFCQPPFHLTFNLDASAAASAIQNHPLTQSVTNGPVAENVKAETAKTQAEFSSLAASRTTPARPAATGQQLTHYHSFFTSLLSWENPRASGIAYASIVLFIFAARYLDILRYAFKLTWMTLGITVLAEASGKALFSHGFVSQLRPKKYFTVSKETLDAMIGDVHELVNFFVIESQRIVFAENVLVSAAAALGAFLSYFLIKIVPLWGLALISTSTLFLAPLIYQSNKEFIDHHLSNASEVVNQQTEQVRQLASHHASQAAETTKQYAADYSAKAQDLIGSATARARSSSPVVSSKPAPVPVKKENVPSYKVDDFPAAPKEDFTAPPVGATASALREEEEPLIAA